MKQKLTCLLLAVSLLLAGCGGGKKYVSVQPHQEQQQSTQTEAAVAKDILDLMKILDDMIRNGTESGIIYLLEFPTERVNSSMDIAVGYAMNTSPLGAYAVEGISYEVGVSGTLPAMAVAVSADIIERGSAMSRPAISYAVPWSGDVLIIGRPAV